MDKLFDVEAIDFDDNVIFKRSVRAIDRNNAVIAAIKAENETRPADSQLKRQYFMYSIKLAGEQ